MSSRPNGTAVLILNHFLDSALVAHHQQLSTDCGRRRDVYLLSDRTQASVSAARLPGDASELSFTSRDLVDLGYPGKDERILSRQKFRNMTLGNAELPLLLFFRQFPRYEHYWVVEYDVRYSGHWEDFFSAFDDDDADLLGTTLQRRAQCPDWSHWHSLSLPTVRTEPEDWIRGFFPVYRMSARALAGLDAAYRDNCAGHMEAALPTILASQGFIIEDIGGRGEFVRPGNENRFYLNEPNTNELSPGTFVYRPVLAEYGQRPDTLWHPVKPGTPKWRRVSKRLLSSAVTLVRDRVRSTRASRSGPMTAPGTGLSTTKSIH